MPNQFKRQTCIKIPLKNAFPSVYLCIEKNIQQKVQTFCQSIISLPLNFKNPHNADIKKSYLQINDRIHET